MTKVFLFTLLLMNFGFADYEINPKNMRIIKRFLRKGNYYDITINGYHCKGSRDWKERWDILKDAVDYKDQRVLDVGTFLGFVPIFTKKYGEAKSATGVDFHYLRHATQLARAFEVDVNFIKAHFDEDADYEEAIGYDYDIVFCMSLMHWVEDQDRFLKYLSNFDRIIYEGHDPDDIEIARLAPYGYKHKILGVSYSGVHKMTERGRTLILFYR